MPEDSGKREEGLPPRKSVQVRSAYSDTMHAHESFARPRDRRASFLPDEFAWLFEHNLKHQDTLLMPDLSVQAMRRSDNLMCKPLYITGSAVMYPFPSTRTEGTSCPLADPNP